MAEADTVTTYRGLLVRWWCRICAAPGLYLGCAAINAGVLWMDLTGLTQSYYHSRPVDMAFETVAFAFCLGLAYYTWRRG